ncbi:MAG: HipA domain-containing protein, partial [Saccharospirillum sp.]
MTVDRCLASLKPLTGAERELGYKKSALRQLFGTQRVGLPLSFSRKDFFQYGVKSAMGMSISGLQQKLSLRLDEKTGLLTPASQGGEYILKPSPEQFPHAAENEHTGMMASRLMGISTAQCALVAFSDGELAYLTRRFDRLPGGVKVHQEDLLQMGGLQPARKYDPTYEQAGDIIRVATNGKRVVLRDLFRRVVLSFVIGNNDLHMKNLSVQKSQGQKGL